MSHSYDTWALSTRAIALGRPGLPGEPLNTPLVPATNFLLGGRFEYVRDSHPTFEAFEEVIGALEGGPATAFSSGMAVIEAALSIGLDLASTGHPPTVAAPRIHYAGTRGLLDSWAASGKIRLHWYDGEDHEGALAAAAAADVLVLESPANPVMTISDLRALAAATSGLSMCDNTYATALITRPLDLGVDIVVQSASKYLAGHSDALLGVAATRHDDLHQRLRTHRALHGAAPGVLETWLGTRGVRTLALRMRQACANAEIIAARLESHPDVAWVRYPGLASDPGHEVAAEQMSMFGAMIAFGPEGGQSAADSICASTRLWHRATSLGGVESTLERRGRLEFELAPPDLIRLSVGCEDVEDLWSDLDRAITT